MANADIGVESDVESGVESGGRLRAASDVHVGGKHVRVTDDDGYQFPMLVMYPSDTPAEPVAFGPFNLDMAANAPPRAGSHPIVLISHGSGGTHLGYLELARRLVRCGYVVCMPEHPGNNRSNNELADSPDNLANRPAPPDPGPGSHPCRRTAGTGVERGAGCCDWSFHGGLHGSGDCGRPAEYSGWACGGRAER